MTSGAETTAHGGIVAHELEELGIAHGDVLDLSVNVNPYGPSPTVRDAIAGADLQRYPDPQAAPARRALAAWLGVEASRVVVGNGAVDVLWSLARAWLRPGDVVMTVEPTFSEMRSAAIRAGARVEEHRLVPESDFALDVTALDRHLARSRPRLVYLCSPSNPVGRCTPPSAVAELADRHPDTLVVADISFHSLSAVHAEDAWRASDRVVWLRSLTKDHGLAGLRIGCAVAPAPVAARIEQERPPWSVNAMAQAAAIAIPDADAQRFVAESRDRLLAERRRIEAALRPLPVRVHPSETVFLAIDLGPDRSATAVRAALLRDHRVLVRDCTSFGLPHHVRVAARAPSDGDRFLSAFTRELRA